MNPLSSWKKEEDSIHWTPYPYSPYNSNKRKTSKNESQAQRTYRAKFGLANFMLNSIRSLIKASFVIYNQGRTSGFNIAIGSFMKNAVRGEYPALEINFSAMEVSKGTIPGLTNWKFYVQDQNVSLTWTNDKKPPHAHMDDQANLLLYDITNNLFIHIDTALRKDESTNCILPKHHTTTEYVAWAFLINRDKSNSSNSQYLAKFTT